MLTESRANADRLLAEARGRAERLTAEVTQRRSELFTALEAERDQLTVKVNGLRDYEDHYRTTFTNFLKTQLDGLSKAELSGNRPDIDSMFGMGNPRVSTPRLDALVDESRKGLN